MACVLFILFATFELACNSSARKRFTIVLIVKDKLDGIHHVVESGDRVAFKQINAINRSLRPKPGKTPIG